MSIIPAITVMKKLQDINRRNGKKMNGEEKQFFVVYVKAK